MGLGLCRRLKRKSPFGGEPTLKWPLPYPASVPNGADLRATRVWGKRVSIVAIVAVTLEPLLVIFAWAMYGAVGLAVAVLALTITVATAFWSLQSQYDALELAIIGVRDESDYSREVKEGLRRLRGAK